MRSLLVGFCVLGILASPAAAKKKGRKRAPAAASAQTKQAISDLMGRYKWGMTRDQVATVIEENVRAEYEEKMKETPDAWEQQKLRDEMMARIKEFQESYYEFDGRKGGWDVSIIDTEFAHKNGETMLVVWERDQRRFFFFHRGKLYKMFVALNAEKFKGKTFDDFAQLIQDRYGTAETRYTPNRFGTPVFDRLIWPPAGSTELQAVDRSGFYGNFCLNLLDLDEWGRVTQGREVNSPKAAGGDPEVEEALNESDIDTKDAHEDVVDLITKRRTEGPKVGGGDEGMLDIEDLPPQEEAKGAADQDKKKKKGKKKRKKR